MICWIFNILSKFGVYPEFTFKSNEKYKLKIKKQTILQKVNDIKDF